jgi:hypothetical protein
MAELFVPEIDGLPKPLNMTGEDMGGVSEDSEGDDNIIVGTLLEECKAAWYGEEECLEKVEECPPEDPRGFWDCCCCWWYCCCAAIAWA